MKFPYGDSDFYQIILQGYHYIDRTDRIPLIEEAGKSLIWLRPRRFGKSLLLSMLENYYDIAKRDEFERIFGGLAIGEQPTELHNQFLILKWDFSLVNPQGNVERVNQFIHDHVHDSVDTFIARYEHYLTRKISIHHDNSLSTLTSLLTAVQLSGHPLYLLIDEYDNFANEVMMSNEATGHARYEALATGQGLVKTLFKNVKGAMDDGLGRVFITGVSPIVLSDVTSGYNIAESLSLRHDLFDLCGFREDEVVEMVETVVKNCEVTTSTVDEMLTLMRTFYNGSRFVYEEVPLLYNPTQVFYFLKYFQRECKYPRQLLDTNLAPDYQKLIYISQRPNGEQLITDALNEQNPPTVVALADRFGLHQMLVEEKSTTMLASLLYYLGALTLAGETETGELILRIPNLVMRKLYAERLAELFLPAVRAADERLAVAKALYANGEMQPACTFVEENFFKVYDNRDYLQANELTIKTAFLTLLYNDTFYIMDSETALTRGYADLTMILRPEMRRYRLLDLVIEFKFIKLNELSLTREKLLSMAQEELIALPLVQEKLRDATDQVTRYYHTLATKYGEPNRLRAYAVVAIGFDRLLWQEASVE